MLVRRLVPASQKELETKSIILSYTMMTTHTSFFFLPVFLISHLFPRIIFFRLETLTCWQILLLSLFVLFSISLIFMLANRTKLLLELLMIAWTRWFIGQTSVALRSAELACMVGSQQPSSKQVTGLISLSCYFLVMVLET